MYHHYFDKKLINKLIFGEFLGNFASVVVVEGWVWVGYPGNEEILVGEMAAVEFGRFSGSILDFDANFHALPGKFQFLVVLLQIRHDPHVTKLNQTKNINNLSLQIHQNILHYNHQY